MMICFTIPTYTISITKILLLLFYIPLLFTPLFFSCYFFHAATPIAYQYFACVVKQQGFVVALCSKPLIMILYLLSPHIQHKHTAPPKRIQHQSALCHHTSSLFLPFYSTLGNLQQAPAENLLFFTKYVKTMYKITFSLYNTIAMIP